jgi:hypothetical protein
MISTGVFSQTDPHAFLVPARIRAGERQNRASNYLANFGGGGTHFSIDVIGSLVYGAWRDGAQSTASKIHG